MKRSTFAAVSYALILAFSALLGQASATPPIYYAPPPANDASALTTGTVASARVSGSYTGITGVGTVTAGTWNGTAISVGSGGTNCTAASITCFNNITGLTASGTTGTTSTNLVFSASPTFTGTVNVAALTTSGLLTGSFANIGLQNSGGTNIDNVISGVLNGSTAMYCWTAGNSNASATTGLSYGGAAATVALGTCSAGDATGILKLRATLAGGAVPTLTGTCTTGTQLGGTTAGSFLATCVAQTVILALPTATNGWVCTFRDLTTPADSISQTAYTTTGCTGTGTTVASDLVTFEARAF